MAVGLTEEERTAPVAEVEVANLLDDGKLVGSLKLELGLVA